MNINNKSYEQQQKHKDKIKIPAHTCPTMTSAVISTMLFGELWRVLAGENHNIMLLKYLAYLLDDPECITSYIKHCSLIATFALLSIILQKVNRRTLKK